MQTALRARSAAPRGACNRTAVAPVASAHLRGQYAPFSGAQARPALGRQRQQQQQQRRGALVIRSAMFDSLSRSIEKAQRLIGKSGTLTAENMKEPLKEVRRALLEADVSLPVVRRFIKKVEERALGTKVLEGVTPDVQFIKTVSNELIDLMGGGNRGKTWSRASRKIILMAGLQGVGRHCAGKLALYLRARELLLLHDVYAAHRQLSAGAAIDVPVFEDGTDVSPVRIAKKGVEEARRLGVDAVIIDTAGRLQVDEGMMAELRDVKSAVRPSDTLLVVDAMTGQEAANLVRSFNEAVDISGAILTKMDGDSRGGAALSVREVSGKPIKFVGVGEKMEALEPFYPERMASRILGMGDVLTLYEKAEAAIKEEDAQKTMERLMEEKFDFNDFLNQWKAMNNMGGLQMLKMMPGFNKISEKHLYEAEKQFGVYEAIIGAMDEEERSNPEVLIKNLALRRRRVAQDSGKSEAEVTKLMAAYTSMKAQVGGMSKLLKLQKAGADPQKANSLLQELVASAGKKVAPGKVRRKKEKDALSQGSRASAHRPNRDLLG
uniref:signal-recognition-particle GTPase n=1 Tax=Chlamydomonas reinhardtii TaxID=3055 RepID=Q9AXU1_CHLRE|nr:chloroplast SRP54 precursor [Chlamydomonas reinhardtii]